MELVYFKIIILMKRSDIENMSQLSTGGRSNLFTLPRGSLHLKRKVDNRAAVHVEISIEIAIRENDDGCYKS